MRVLIVSREYPPASEGGISRRLGGMIPRLVAKGMDVEVLCFGGKSIAGEKVYALDPKSSILYTRSGTLKFRDYPLIFLDIVKLNRAANTLIKTGGFDIVHVEEPIFGPFIARKIPLVITVHTTRVGEARALSRSGNHLTDFIHMLSLRLVGARLDGLCLSKARKIIAVSPEVKKEIMETYGLSEQLIQVIPNGVQLLSRKTDLPRKSNLSEELQIVYVGRLVARKRVSDLIRACCLLKRKGEHGFRCTIVGSGPSENGLKTLVTELDLEKHVSFAGQVSDNILDQILKGADILVLPSEYEGHPISLLEGMVYGCVPIAARIPSTTAIIQDGTNGFLYDVCDADGLASKISILLHHRGLIHQLGSKAQETASGYSWDTAVQRQVNLYVRF